MRLGFGCVAFAVVDVSVLTVCWDARCIYVWLVVVVRWYIGGSVFLLDCVYP